MNFEEPSATHMNSEETLPPWVHAWHEKPKVIVKGGRVLFKSMPVYLKSDGKSHPDTTTLSFPIAGTTMTG